MKGRKEGGREEEEEKELQKLEAFKITHKRPKRVREMHLEAGPLMKKMRIIQRDGEDFQVNEEAFQKDGMGRVEAMRARLSEERGNVLKKMNKLGKGRVQEHVQINENRRKDICSSEAHSSVPIGLIWKWTTREALSASQSYLLVGGIYNIELII